MRTSTRSASATRAVARSCAARSKRRGWCTTAATRCSTCGSAPATAPTTAGSSRRGLRTKPGCWSHPAISTARPVPTTCGSRSCSPTTNSNSRSTVSCARPHRKRTMSDDLAKLMTRLWEAGDDWRDVQAVAQSHDAVRTVIGMLDRGEVRVAEVVDGDVVVNEWAKHAILMWFRVQEMQIIEAGPFEYVDKLPLKKCYKAAGVRVVPGASARFGAYLAPTVVMMPCYVNIGAYVDAGTMIDTWATVASCAQIGKNVHLSGGVGIGGVLEPPQAVPVVVEDDCFIGSRCMIVDGARIRRGAKIGAGLIL